METWILLRGLTRERGHWGNFPARLERALPHSQVVALDLPGNGALNQQPSALRVRDMVAHCRTQLARQGLSPPYGLLAMSLGALVAVDWAHEYPGEVRANVLINTSMRPFNPFYERLRPANYATLLKLMLPGATDEEWERSIFHMTTSRTDVQTVPAWIALRRSHPVSRANALRQMIAAAIFCAPSYPPKTSTLLLASEGDRLVSVECSKALARHWQCPLRLHPGAGHDLPHDDGSWVLEQVCQWLPDPSR